MGCCMENTWHILDSVNNHRFHQQTLFYCTSLYCASQIIPFFYELEVYGNPASSKSVWTAFAHFVSNILTILQLFFLFYFYFFIFIFCEAWGIGRFPGQGSNLSHSYNPSHCSDNAESLAARPPGNSKIFSICYVWSVIFNVNITKRLQLAQRLRWSLAPFSNKIF